jgi:hypothetical protein
MLSHRFRTIFVHIPKTAGESLLHVFVRTHGLDWDSRGELLLRYNPDRDRGPERLTHLFAREYVELGYIGQQDFAAYFKFAVIRNPYTRAISEYRFRHPAAECSIESFLERIPDDPYDDRARHMAPQVEFVLDRDGRIVVDEILRFERLATDLPPVLEKIFGTPQQFEHTNRSGAPPVTELSGYAKRLIGQRFEADFDLFQYPRET